MSRRPQGIFKNFGQKNFGLNFRSLIVEPWTLRLMRLSLLVGIGARPTDQKLRESQAKIR